LPYTCPAHHSRAFFCPILSPALQKREHFPRKIEDLEKQGLGKNVWERWISMELKSM